jgi:hypothetical protein
MKESGLQKSMESMREKIDLLMGGENEANKLIDCILPSLTTIESKVSRSQCSGSGSTGSTCFLASRIRIH